VWDARASEAAQRARDEELRRLLLDLACAGEEQGLRLGKMKSQQHRPVRHVM
jgi:hypothetical protein